MTTSSIIYKNQVFVAAPDSDVAFREALVTTKSELQKLQQMVQPHFRKLEDIAQDYEQESEDRYDIREDFEDAMDELRQVLQEEISTLSKWARQAVTRPEEARNLL